MNLQIFGGRGGKSGKKQQAKTTIPSRVTYEQFRAMSDNDKYNFIRGVIDNPNITVPDYLDKSVTSKVMYAMGMNSKPQVVSDAELDKINGDDLYRLVYDTKISVVHDPKTSTFKFISPLSGTEILDQIKYSDYTQLSGAGGSVNGRAIYFATDFNHATAYGIVQPNPVMMRAKINPNANIVAKDNLMKITDNSSWVNKLSINKADSISLTALANGIDGWRLKTESYGDYVMMINRGALTVSSTSKKINNIGENISWHESKDVK